MSRPSRLACLVVSLAIGLSVLASGAAAASAAPTSSLLVAPSAAFSVLGHSCGGIQQQAFATGFDATSGDPTGDVYLWTRCGGSGRGGGYRSTTYTAWVGVTWDFSGAVHSLVILSTSPTALSPTFSATDKRGDHVFNALTAINVLPANCTVANTTYCTYRAYLSVPAPGTPTGVTVSQAGDALVVKWIAAKGGGAPTASTITATPTKGGTALTATAVGTATSATVGGVAASTSYSITVTSTNAGGPGPTSSPVVFNTQTATTPPSAPSAIVVSWSPDGALLQATWYAAVPGDSPVNDYQLQVTQFDPTGTPIVIDAGTSTAATVTGLDNTQDWSVQVRAHNAAGWGLWSIPVVLPAF